MTVAQEEVFGPVVSVIPFRDEQHAVEIANNTVFGLALAESGRATSTGRTGWPGPSAPGRSGSITTAAVIRPSRSEDTERAATAGLAESTDTGR